MLPQTCQRKSFLRLFYTVNQTGFMLRIILTYYQQCPVPLNMDKSKRTKIKPSDVDDFFILSFCSVVVVLQVMQRLYWLSSTQQAKMQRGKILKQSLLAFLNSPMPA